MDKGNKRCPLQAECERKCKHAGHELECDYYSSNARDELVIADQEEIRRAREREQEERWYAENFRDDEEDLGDEEPDGGGGISNPSYDTGNLVYLPIDQLYPHPDNPRKALGDLTELADSIRENGVFQNLTVVPGHWATMDEYVKIAKAEGVPKDMAMGSYEPKGMWEESGYTIIIGHRRRAAAELAGLGALPCVITGLSEREQVSTMLLENMQRSDLTVYEVAQGFQMMIDLGDTVEGIAEKTGFSKTTVRRRLKMAELDQKVLQQVSDRQISLADFDKLAQIEDISKRNKVLRSIGTNNFTSEVKIAVDHQEMQKNLPIAKALAKKLGANKISRSDTYGSEYTMVGKKVNLKTWDGVSPVAEGESRKLFYVLDKDWGELSFYVKSPKPKKKKRSAEEIEKEKRIAEAHEELKQLSALHYELRKNFVENLTYSNKLKMPVTLGALLACAGKAVCYLGSDREAILDLLGIEDKYENRKGSALAEAFDKLSPNAWPKLIYAFMKDSPSRSYCSKYTGIFPKYEECTELDLIYKWLLWCGYEMSDDEIALQNGTHEVLHRGDAK